MWFTEYENQEFEAENEKFKQIQIQTFLLKWLEILPGDQLEMNEFVEVSDTFVWLFWFCINEDEQLLTMMPDLVRPEKQMKS